MDTQHLNGLTDFLQVPQSKRRRRLLILIVPALIMAIPVGACMGIKRFIEDIWYNWKSAWDIVDP